MSAGTAPLWLFAGVTVLAVAGGILLALLAVLLEEPLDGEPADMPPRPRSDLAR